MKQQGGNKQTERRRGMLADSASLEALDAFLVLDRMLMEFSMRLYNVPRRERLTLRGHHRRLHCAVRLGRGGRAPSPRSVPVCPLKLLAGALGSGVVPGVRDRRYKTHGAFRKSGDGKAGVDA